MRVTSSRGLHSKIQGQADETVMMNSIFKSKLEEPVSRMGRSHMFFVPQFPEQFKNQKSKKEFEQNYVELFNKSCIMMLPKMPEIQKVESLAINEYKMTKFKAVYLSIPSKNKIGPLFIAVNHSDTHQKGIYIYISTRQKYPSEESNEGAFYMTQTQKEVIRFKSIKGQHFENDLTYVSIFCHAEELTLHVCMSFRNKSCVKALNDCLQGSQTIGRGSKQIMKVEDEADSTVSDIPLKPKNIIDFKKSVKK